MARKKTEKKELTVEERLQQEKENGLRSIQRELDFINTPSYFFNIGDEVELGSLKQCVIDEILYDGKVYGVKCVATDNNWGNPFDYETYRVVPWTTVRPISSGNSSFAENQDIRLDFYNSTVKGLILMNYHFGIDFNPEYQRGYVWELEDKELLIDSIFKNIDIGKFVFVHLSDEEWTKRGFGYEILDGKQRLSTIIEFYENKLAFKGKYFNDLSKKDRLFFENHAISKAEIRESDKKTILKYFLMLNRTGKVMDEAHLNQVEKMLEGV